MSSRISRSSYIIGGSGGLADSGTRIYKENLNSITSGGIKRSTALCGSSIGYDVRLDPAVSSILAEVNGTDFNSTLLNSTNTLSGSFKENTIFSPTSDVNTLTMSTLGNYGIGAGLTATNNRQSRHKSLTGTYRENFSSRNRSISPGINTAAQLRSQRTAAAVRAADEAAAKALGTSKAPTFASDIMNSLDRPASSASLLMRPASASSLPTVPSVASKQVAPIINTPTGSHRHILRSGMNDPYGLSSSANNHDLISSSTSKIYPTDNDDGLVERLRERLMQRERLATIEHKLLGSSSSTNSIGGGTSSFNSIGLSSSLQKEYNKIGSLTTTMAGSVPLPSELNLNTATSGTGLFSSTSSKLLQSPTKHFHSGSRLLLSSMSNADKRSIATGTDTPTYHKTYDKFGRTTPPMNRKSFNTSEIGARDEVPIIHSPVKSKNELMEEASEGKIHYCEVHGTLVRSSSSTDLRESGSDVSTFLRSRARHRTLAYGVSAADLGIAKCIANEDSWTNYRGFNSDMSTKVLRDEVCYSKACMYTYIVILFVVLHD